MGRPLKILTFLLWVFLLSQSHSLVESLPSDQPDRVSFLPKHKSTPPNPLYHGSPQPAQEPQQPPSHRHHPSLPPHPKETRSPAQQRQIEGRNLGKKIGVMFLGIGVTLQVVVVGVLGFKRWQISKKMKERQWDFTA